jgi:hypothetical protein
MYGAMGFSVWLKESSVAIRQAKRQTTYLGIAVLPDSLLSSDTRRLRPTFPNHAYFRRNPQLILSSDRFDGLNHDSGPMRLDQNKNAGNI